MKFLPFILIVTGLLLFNYLIMKKVKNKIIKVIPCILSFTVSAICFIMVFGIKKSLGISKSLTIFFIGIFMAVSFIFSLIMLIYDYNKNKKL